MHPVAGLRLRTDTVLTKLVELVKGTELDLELQCGTAGVAGQRHQEPGREAGLAGGLDFAHYAQLAQIAERAKFDAIFFAD